MGFPPDDPGLETLILLVEMLELTLVEATLLLSLAGMLQLTLVAAGTLAQTP